MTRANGEGSVYRRGARGGAARPLPWVASYYVVGPDGTEHRKSESFATRKLANAALEKARNAIADGLPLPDARLTFGTVMDQWLTAQRTAVAPATWLGYSSICETWLRSRLGSAKMRGLDAAAIGRVVADVAAVRAPRTARLAREVMRAICAFAAERGSLARNPVLLVKAPSDRSRVDALGAPVQTVTRRCFTTDEVRVLLAGTREDRLGPLFVVAFATGARLGELRALRWADWDPTARRLSITRSLGVDLDRRVAVSQPKTKKSERSIQVGTVAADALAVQYARQADERADAGERWQDHGLIFTTTVGTPLDSSNVLHVFQRHLARLSLPKMRFHDARHYAATEALASGIPAHEVARLLGHSSPAVTLQIYAHVTPRGADRTADVFDRALGSGLLDVRP
jgi:integrase